MARDEISRAAKQLSLLGASKGGLARAQKLDASSRRDVAKRAAEARWKLPVAEFTGDLEIGGIILPCAVVELEGRPTRLLSQGGFLKSIGRSRTPKAGTGATVAEMPAFLSAKNLKRYIDKDLRASTTPIKFRDLDGRVAYGYRAELLAKVCRVFLEARANNDLMHQQAHIARKCELLMAGFAEVGIIALVDEATGYQLVRSRNALAEFLEHFIKDEYGKWAKRFPNEFYRELFRLKQLDWPFRKNPPQYVGHWTNDLVYKRLAPGVLQELRNKNPRTESGHRKQKFHQWLTEDVGHAKLQEHLSAVIALMKAFDDWNVFHKALDRALPPYKALPLFDDESE